MIAQRDTGKATVLAVVVTLMVLVVAVVAAGILTKRLYIGFKAPTQQIALVQHVCTDQDISKFNQVISSTDKSDWSALSKTVTSKNNYKSDANCVYMVYQYALRLKDDALISSSFTTLESLNENGVYASGSIASLSSIEQLKSMEVMYKTRTTPVDGPIQGEG